MALHVRPSYLAQDLTKGIFAREGVGAEARKERMELEM
jgi:hypothetical protein